LKVRAEAYTWLNAAAIEETSYVAATRTDRKRKWMSGFDLCYLTAGATKYFERIGADTIQSVCTHYAQKRQAARRVKLRWRVSRGARRSLGWLPFKAASLKRKGAYLRFAGKCFRVFERERLDGIKWQAGCFAQDAGDIIAGKRGSRFSSIRKPSPPARGQTRHHAQRQPRPPRSQAQ
jgi:hypothetical protein